MPARDLRRFKVTDFSGGLNIKLSPAKLARLRDNKYLTTATNVVYNTDGSVSKRWGMRLKCNSATVTGDRITGGVFFQWASDALDVFSDSDGKVYKLDDYDTPSVTSIKSGLTGTGQSNWAAYNALLVMVNGADAPQSWDGTTWQALSGSPPSAARQVVVHANRMFMTGSLASAKHTLYYSALNLVTDWTTASDAGNMDIHPDDFKGIKSLVPSNQELVIFRAQRPYRLRGIGPVTGYTIADHMTPTGGSVGTDNTNQGAVFAANDVWWVSSIGVHRLRGVDSFGDLEESFISEPIEPFFREGADLILPKPADQSTGSCIMVYDQSASALMVALQDGASSFKTILHYDIGLNAWSRWSLPVNSGRALWPSVHMGEIGGLVDPLQHVEMNLAIDSGGGQAGLVAFDHSETSDIGTSFASVGIPATFAHVSDLGAAGMEKVPRHIYLYFNEESSSTTMTLNLYADFKTTAAFTTTFDIASATAEDVIVKRVDISSFVCEFLTVELSNSTAAKTFTCLGYEVLWRPRREIRRSE